MFYTHLLLHTAVLALSITGTGAFGKEAILAPILELLHAGLIDRSLFQPVIDKNLTLNDISGRPTEQLPVYYLSGASQCKSNDTVGRARAVPDVVDCVNAQYDYKSMTWQQYLGGVVRSVRVFGSYSIYDEASRPSAPSVPVTIIVGATVSRLRQLYAQCRSWSGPLSAVLLQPLIQPAGGLTPDNLSIMQLSARLVRRFIEDVKQAHDWCEADVLLVYEIYQDEESYKLLYPYNTLRNLARLQARTPLIGMIDVDMLVSKSVYQLFESHDTSSQLVNEVQSKKQLLLIPAFNVRGQHEKTAWADALTSERGGKDFLLHSMQDGLIYQFGGEHYSVGHRLINYSRWVDANSDYNVEYEFMCEPWYIGDRLSLPWYDVRYRGYGFDKVQQILHAYNLGYEFQVLTKAFLVHREHIVSNASLVFKASFSNPNKSSAGYLLKEYVHGLFRDQVKMHIAGSFKAVLDASTKHCQSKLNWW